MKRWQSIGLGLLISIVAIIYTLHGNDLSLVGAELVHGRYIYLIPYMIFSWLAFYFRALRWRAILSYRMGITHAFHLTTIGNFLNSFLPLRLGEVARAFLATRLSPPIPLLTAASSLLVERFTDLLALLVILLWTISLHVTNPTIVSAAYAMGVLAIGGTALLIVLAARRTMASRLVTWSLTRWPALSRFRLQDFLENLLDGLQPLTSPTGLALILLWTAFSWLVSVVVALLLLYVFYDNPNWAAALVVVGSGSLAIALPAMPGNVGPFEAAIITGLTLVGMVGGSNSPERAVAFAVTFHVLLVVVYAVLGTFGLSQEKITLGELRRLISIQRQPAPVPAATPSETIPPGG